jgi:hypothetical protein
VDDASLTPRLELAQRVSGGIEVTLYWSPGNGTTVEIRHAATAELIAFPVAADRALDAYYHPFAHLRIRMLEPALSGAS